MNNGNTPAPAPFKLGEALTHEELRSAFIRITGYPLPGRVDLGAVARKLAAERPQRFEYEVNRLRGFAFEMGEEGTDGV